MSDSLTFKVAQVAAILTSAFASGKFPPTTLHTIQHTRRRDLHHLILAGPYPPPPRASPPFQKANETSDSRHARIAPMASRLQPRQTDLPLHHSKLRPRLYLRRIRVTQPPR